MINYKHTGSVVSFISRPVVLLAILMVDVSSFLSLFRHFGGRDPHYVCSGSPSCGKSSDRQ